MQTPRFFEVSAKLNDTWKKQFIIINDKTLFYFSKNSKTISKYLSMLYIFFFFFSQ